MSLSKDKSNENPFEKAFKAYIGLLQTRPILTKSITRYLIDNNSIFIIIYKNIEIRPFIDINAYITTLLIQ